MENKLNANRPTGHEFNGLGIPKGWEGDDLPKNRAALVALIDERIAAALAVPKLDALGEIAEAIPVQPADKKMFMPVALIERLREDRIKKQNERIARKSVDNSIQGHA
ncbi:MAG: hypothetical protein ORN98_10825 [Alphaproteobacteria bacterium]|nr:hypothetical protein [Alphaproteobacteria bacterium]